MPIIKVLRHGQVTLPADIRKTLKLTEGVLLQVEVHNGAVTIRPLDRRAAKRRIRELLEEERAAYRDWDPKEIDTAIAEAIAAVRAEERQALERRKR